MGESKKVLVCAIDVSCSREDALKRANEIIEEYFIQVGYAMEVPNCIGDGWDFEEFPLEYPSLGDFLTYMKS